MPEKVEARCGGGRKQLVAREGDGCGWSVARKESNVERATYLVDVHTWYLQLAHWRDI